MRRGVVRWHLLANFSDSGILAALTFLCVPFYIRLMGIEAFGLVGFFATLQSTLSILDMGLSPTMSREMALCSAHPERRQDAKDLSRTLEYGYWSISLLIVLGIAALASVLATRWIHATTLETHTVRHAIILMGLVAACQWPLTFYSGGLRGLDRQVLLSGINITGSVLRLGGAVLVLWLIAPTITVFFWWQAVASVVQTIATTVAFWSSFPPVAGKARFRPTLVHSIWRFAGGATGIAIETIILTQADKIVLSKMIPLEEFGYYTLAWSAAAVLATVSGPSANTFFPKYARLVALKDDGSLRDLFHRSSQLMSALLFPVMAVLLTFTQLILRLWIGSSGIAERSYPIVRVLVVGFALNGIATLPYCLQLAYGWTELTLIVAAVLSVVAAPAVILMTYWRGALGAASMWPIINAVYLVVQTPIMFRRLMRTEMWRWYLRDVGLPLAVALVSVRYLSLVVHIHFGSTAAAKLVLVAVVVLGITSWASSHLREWMRNEFQRLV